MVPLPTSPTRILTRLIAAGLIAFAAAACDVRSDVEWVCTFKLDAGEVKVTASAARDTREEAERVARASLCGNDRLDLSISQQDHCEKSDTAPPGFLEWRLDWDCTTR